MAKLVSKTYGDALFEVALEKNQLDEFLDEVKAAQTEVGGQAVLGRQT